MPSTTTIQTQSLQVASVAGMQAINRYLYKNLLFCPEMIDAKGQPTGKFGEMGNVKPKMYNLSSYFGRNLQKGQTIYVPEESERLYAQQKVEGVKLEDQTMTFNRVPLTVTSHTAVAVTLEDYQNYYNNIENHKQVVKDAMLAAICQEIEERTFSLFPQFMNSTGTGAGVAFDKSALRTANRELRLRNVPNGNWFAVVTPYAYDSLADEVDEYQLAGQAGADSISSGQIAYKKVNGFNIFQSNHIHTVGGAAKMAAFADDTFMFAIGFQPRFQEDYSITKLAVQMVIDVIFAVGIKRQEYGQLLDYDDTNNL